MDELDQLCSALGGAGEAIDAVETTVAERSPLAPCANSPQRAREKHKATGLGVLASSAPTVDVPTAANTIEAAGRSRPPPLLKRDFSGSENGLGALVKKQQRVERAAAKFSSGCYQHKTLEKQPKQTPRRVFQDAGQATTVFRSSGGLRIKNPLVSSSQLTTIMESHACIRIDQIRHRIIQDTVPKRWCTIAVVGEVSSTRTSEATGSQYGIWKLTDLNESMMYLYVFGSAYQDYCGEMKPGAVVCLVGGKTRRTGDAVTLSIDAYTQLLVLGESRDFGYCKGRTKNGGSCRAPVNTSRCEYCSYHVGKAYKEMSSLRKELQGGSLKTAFASKNSKLKWSVGRFQSAGGPGAGGGGEKVGRERLQSSAARVGGNSSTMGSRYLVTCADPTRALNAVREAESKKRQLNMARGTGFLERAPIPARHLASVVIGEQNNNSIVRKKHQNSTVSDVGKTTAAGWAASRQAKPGPSASPLALRAIDPKDGTPSPMVDLDDGVGTSFAASLSSSLPARAQAAAILRQKRASGEVINQAPLAPAFLAKSLEAHSKKIKISEKRGDVSQVERDQPHPDASRPKENKAGPTAPAVPPVKAQRITDIPPSEPSSFGALFGDVIREMEATHGSEGKVESRYKDAVEGEDHANLMSRLDVLEKKDSMVQKMEATTSLKVNAFRCGVCSSLMERKHDRCLKEHPQAVARTETVKRWWSCSDCKKRFTTLGVAYPRGCCVKCGSTVATFEKQGMVPLGLDAAQRFADTLGNQAVASREGIQVRGTEHGKFMYR